MMNMTLAALLSTVLLSTMVASAPLPPTATVVSILWREAQKFLSLAGEGEISVSFHGSPLNFQYLNNDPTNTLVRIQVVKPGEACFITYSADKKFAVERPENDNDVFQLVVANNIGGFPIYALRAVNLHTLVAEQSEEGSASGTGPAERTSDEDETTATTEECYFGIRNADSQPECFPSDEYAATRFHIIPSL
jgi:hypothetical protein